MSECNICLEQFSESKILKFCNDKHTFCKECFENYVNTVDENKYGIRCPYCRNNIDYKIKEDEITIINGKKEGLHKLYYKSGQLKIEANFVNDVLEGLYKKYYKNGKLHKIENYKNGKLDGFCKTYMYVIKGTFIIEELYKDNIRIR